MAFTSREIHRDLGYFYLGLLISFASSGLMMNHRDTWHPDKYTTETKEITIQLPQNETEITEGYVKGLSAQLGIEDKFRNRAIKKGALRISYEKHDVEIDIKTGKGEITTFFKTPIIAQAMKIHKETSNWWIYYSDIFALSVVTIAITGTMMYAKGNKFSFRERGWKLTLAGILFPLIFLFFLA
jgi:uncharacterized protein